ncbi:hypothetical protein [Leptospira stimsonii]|uniref:Lipoprotein n=1 Tax=Leptospira stimsonii TaxID=2202203 RepID=A0ABY2MUC2_9LEPT|nr:hypothetical protein [Leptospira stimsonii]TGK15402.1 hypothetical protein EHO98_14465 [Leptospira stimsonii]TGM08266.1 hypothetical protein EHQ90_22430 [Leptospira stimsonii]
MKRKIILFTAVLFISSCIGIVRPPSIIRDSISIPRGKPLRLEFTGFTFYTSEMNHIKKNLQEKGYREDERSDILLEIILQEKEAEYEYRGFHFLNLIASFLTLGIVPFHIKSEHILTYRIFESGNTPKESVHELLLDQWSGWVLIPFSPFYWPSTSFEKSLINSLEEFEKQK